MKWLTILLLLVASTTNASSWLDTPHGCLAANIYYEARGEALVGQYMVAHVTMNRVASTKYPNTVCEVVKQRRQFSWYSPRHTKVPKDMQAWEMACSVAAKFIYEKPLVSIDITEGALFYHTTGVHPIWADSKSYIGRVGNHLFYR